MATTGSSPDGAAGSFGFSAAGAGSGTFSCSGAFSGSGLAGVSAGGVGGPS